MIYDTDFRDSHIRQEIIRLVSRWREAFLKRRPVEERDIALAIIRLAGEGATIAERRIK